MPFAKPGCPLPLCTKTAQLTVFYGSLTYTPLFIYESLIDPIKMERAGFHCNFVAHSLHPVYVNVAHRI